MAGNDSFPLVSSRPPDPPTGDPGRRKLQRTPRKAPVAFPGELPPPSRPPRLAPPSKAGRPLHDDSNGATTI
eukprot:9566782-Alexandrium_andersonii.AAC.1